MGIAARIMTPSVCYILQPQLSQALTIVHLLRSTGRPIRIVGVVRSGEMVRNRRKYDAILIIDDYRALPEGAFVVPTGAESTAALLERGDVKVGQITMTRDALLVYDKREFLESCFRHGIPIPLTYQRCVDIPSDAYPLFYKQAYERGGGARGVAYSAEGLPGEGAEELIFQEFLEEPGTYGVGFLARGGLMMAAMSHLERESIPASGGSAVLLERFEDPKLLELTARMVEVFNYSGWGLAEFKRRRGTGEYVAMEINAKFWASCDFTFNNEPAFARQLFGIEVERRNVDRVFYVNRGLQRGIRFIVGDYRAIRAARWVAFPGLWRSLVRGLIPETFSQTIARWRGRAA